MKIPTTKLSCLTSDAEPVAGCPLVLLDAPDIEEDDAALLRMRRSGCRAARPKPSV